MNATYLKVVCADILIRCRNVDFSHPDWQTHGAHLVQRVANDGANWDVNVTLHTDSSYWCTFFQQPLNLINTQQRIKSVFMFLFESIDLFLTCF